MRFVLGAAYTKEKVDTTDPQTGARPWSTGRSRATARPCSASSTGRSATPSSWSFAGRVDRNTLHATQFSPKAALVYSINPKNSLRFTYNQAFQVANYSEFFLHTRISSFPIGGFVARSAASPVLPQPVDCGITEDFIPILAVGNNDLKLEKTKAWEIGYSGHLGQPFLPHPRLLQREERWVHHRPDPAGRDGAGQYRRLPELGP